MHQALRERMQAAGQKPSVPAAEFESGKFSTGTDAPIERFANDAGIDPVELPLLSYYSERAFQKYGEMFRELRPLKGR